MPTIITDYNIHDLVKSYITGKPTLPKDLRNKKIGS
jgi:hypothetical protein